MNILFALTLLLPQGLSFAQPPAATYAAPEKILAMIPEPPSTLAEARRRLAKVTDERGKPRAVDGDGASDAAYGELLKWRKSMEARQTAARKGTEPGTMPNAEQGLALGDLQQLSMQLEQEVPPLLQTDFGAGAELSKRVGAIAAFRKKAEALLVPAFRAVTKARKAFGADASVAGMSSLGSIETMEINLLVTLVMANHAVVSSVARSAGP
jgi:hypothetical protein